MSFDDGSITELNFYTTGLISIACCYPNDPYCLDLEVIGLVNAPRVGTKTLDLILLK